MATIYAPPADLPVPNAAGFIQANDFAGFAAAEAAYVATLRARALAQAGAAPDPLIGEVVRFPHADGHAQYLIWQTRPLRLVHLPLGDAWSLPAAHERGLRLSDVRDRIAAQHRLTSLFARGATVSPLSSPQES
jgi:hypothetical protein